MMRKISLLAIFILSIYYLQSCTQQGECEGRIVVENPLPDITIQLEDGEHTIDLTSPPVFKHTANKNLTYSQMVVEGIQILGVTLKRVPETDKASLLILKPREKGTAKVLIEAQDDCIEGVEEEFTVTIE